MMRFSNNFLRILSGIVFLSVSALATAQSTNEPVTTLNDVLESVQEHFPLIKAAQAEIISREALVQAAQGAFDPVLEGSYKNRLSGFYDGSSVESFYRKRIPGFSAEVFAGYRRSSGNFPVYENGLATNNDGESRFGVSFSLLRDRDFDELRYKTRTAEVDVQSQRFALQQEMLNTLQQAYIAYAQWLQAARLLGDYTELMTIAETGQMPFGAVLKVVMLPRFCSWITSWPSCSVAVLSLMPSA